MFTISKSLYVLIFLVLILAACQPSGPPEPVVETLVLTEVVEATPLEVIHVVTPTPEPAGPRTLVICLEGEPNYEFLLSETSALTVYLLREAVEDGPIDSNSFAYQPVILEKLPSLANGDAILQTVNVSEGDTVVDATGEVVTLDPAADPPIMLIPTGGEDPVAYQGGDFEMEQVSATFRLLPNLLWSDGVPLTAADSVYTFNLEAGSPNWIDDGTAAYEAIDDRTIQWTGMPGLQESYYATRIYRPRPQHIWSQYSADELPGAEDLSRVLVGWGPYIIAERIPGESITLHKNPNYFRAGEGLPKFDRLILRFTGDTTNGYIAALLAGECDLIFGALDDQVELLLELHEAGKLKTSFTTGTIWEHIGFGIQHVDYDDGYHLGEDRPDFFSDVRTRQAFAMCMDRQALVDTIFYGQSLVPDSYVPQQHPLYNPDMRHYEFDVAAGSALLEEVGWLNDDGDPGTPRVAQDVPNVPDGTLLEVDYETTSGLIRQQTTAIIQDSLAQCGIKTNIQLYGPDEWFADGPEGKLWGRQYDLGQFAWATNVAPPCDIYLSSLVTGPAGEKWVSIQDGLERTISDWGWAGPNQMGFTNDEYDQACNAALRSLPGQPENEAAHLEAQRIFGEQLPMIPLYVRIKLTAMRPDMCGVIMNPTAFNAGWNIEEFDYGEGCEE
jgi:peptide/nickel transport system substrate-binding protein